jgi:hypothetical protein
MTENEIWAQDEARNNPSTEQEIELFESQFEISSEEFQIKTKNRKKQWHPKPINLSLTDLRKIGIVESRGVVGRKLFFTQKNLQQAGINWDALTSLGKLK